MSPGISIFSHTFSNKSYQKIMRKSTVRISLPEHFFARSGLVSIINPFKLHNSFCLCLASVPLPHPFPAFRCWAILFCEHRSKVAEPLFQDALRLGCLLKRTSKTQAPCRGLSAACISRQKTDHTAFAPADAKLCEAFCHVTLNLRTFLGGAR